jgi:threonine synthase
MILYTMKYISTRDIQGEKCEFTDILLSGLAPEGGLYVPTHYPNITSQLAQLRERSYSELAFYIIRLFVGDSIPALDLDTIIKKTYHPSVFGSEEITPVTHLSDQIYVQDLSSGPSLAFKDLAMQFLGHVMDYTLKQQGKPLTIVGASSGDTVSAAEEAMRGKRQIKVVMLTPKTGMSPFQKAQAGSILDDNIFNVSIPGPFDICQDLVKALNRDVRFKNDHHIGAVNSINWGRICAQVVYYFKGYFSVTSDNSEPVDVVVPSGNFGNVLAGYVAKQMGLPIRRLIVATNENQGLDVFLKTGSYKQRDIIVTSSPSMDISKASNIERLFFDLLDRKPDILSETMAEFETTKSVDLSHLYPKLRDDLGFISGRSTHNERRDVIKSVYSQFNYIIDPHTASAVKVAQDYHDQSKIPMICMETAKPTKFESAVKEAIGFIPNRPKGFNGLEDREQRFYEIDASVEALKAFIKENIA